MKEIYFFKPKKSTQKQLKLGAMILIYSHDSSIWQFGGRADGKVIEINGNMVKFELVDQHTNVDVQEYIEIPVISYKFSLASDCVYSLPKEFIVDVEYED